MYRYGQPLKSRRDGLWWYWGSHPKRQPAPDLVGGFKTEHEARKHAEKHGSGRPKLGDVRKPTAK